jgi:phosphoribosylamine--glycine ligase
MGSYSDSNHLLPFLGKGQLEQALGIMQKTIAAFRKKTGKPYVGILYGGFMATANGVKLIEYNCRFGDPEAMNVLSLMRSDLYETLWQMAEGKLAAAPSFEKKATVCKYIVPEGYPGKSIQGQPISIDYPKISSLKANLFYSSVCEKDGIILTQSSRSIGLVGIAKTIGEAEKIAESACSAVKGKVWHRRDIGTKGLLEKRVAHMKELGAP